MRPIEQSLLVLSLVALSLPAFAEQAPPRLFEITPFAGYRIGGSFDDENTNEEFDLDDDSSFGLILNLREKSYTQWEFAWSHQETSVDLGEAGSLPAKRDLEIDYFQVGGTYLWDGRWARPFMVATIGAAHYNPDSGLGSSETYFAFSIGGGLNFWPTERFGLRLDGRFYGTLLGDDSDIFCVSDPGGGQAGCLIRTSGDLLWQWEMLAGAVIRF